jgi:hypothetical protein
VAELTADFMENANRSRQADQFAYQFAYGFRLAADRKHIEPDRAEQAVLQRIRKLRTDGLSLRATAAALNRRHLTTRQGSPWRMEYVARIERNEVAPLRSSDVG